jgi:2-hydroxychromene-2-carboxylate isomerase
MNLPKDIQEQIHCTQYDVKTWKLRARMDELAKTGLAGIPELTPSQQAYIRHRLQELEDELAALEGTS